jgi:hypothetical protein
MKILFEAYACKPIDIQRFLLHATALEIRMDQALKHRIPGAKAQFPSGISRITPVVDSAHTPGAIYCQVHYERTKADCVTSFPMFVSSHRQDLILREFDPTHPIYLEFNRMVGVIRGQSFVGRLVQQCCDLRHLISSPHNPTPPI